MERDVKYPIVSKKKLMRAYRVCRLCKKGGADLELSVTYGPDDKVVALVHSGCIDGYNEGQIADALEAFPKVPSGK